MAHHHSSLSNFAKLAMASQVALLILYATCTGYDISMPQDEVQQSLNRQYPMFQDVHVMIFIGFGFLMTFLSKYGWSAVSVNFYLACLAIQWSILVRGFCNQVYDRSFHQIQLSLFDFLNADFSAAVVLITFGVLLGNASPLQMLIIVWIEIVASIINETLVFRVFQAADAGGSMVLHMFGGFFGLAASAGLAGIYERNSKRSGPQSSAYVSDLIAMVGTVFLFIYWPSFNAAVFGGYQQSRAIINTILALTSSAMCAFFVSNILHKGKFNMVHIQNSTLAGGVAVGSSANLVVNPWGAILIGIISGSLSVLGYNALTPYLKSRFHINDTAGVANLHAFPGLFGGLVTVLVTAAASSAKYGEDLAFVFIGMDPMGKNRTASVQALYQFFAVLSTFGISIVSGFFTGALLRVTTQVPEAIFEDSEFWVMEVESPIAHGMPVESTDTIEIQKLQ
eukprot:TRINITY_DN1298_c0_g1_i1.p1 TRINITY_DN1298_c0_g1~~TRINITY_DN1298_c0_g1_i1.p1  ORF type:complete len:479 (+),score=117.87 TRINITY_DN1298_c0_g1_i1:84-1439(+)